MLKLPSGVGRQGLIMVGLPLIFQLIFILFIEILIVHTKTEIESQYKSALLVDRALVFAQTVLDETIHCMMTCLVGKQAAYNDLATMRQLANKDLEPLRKELSSTPEGKDDLKKIESCYNNISNNWEYMLKHRESFIGRTEATQNKNAGTLQGLSDANVLLGELNDQLNNFIASRQLKIKLNPETRKMAIQRIKLLLILSISTGIIASIVVAVQFSTSISARLKTLVENTKRFKHGEELLTPVPGCDEITAYDRAFHDMAAEMERAKEYKAQLLSIASHEVRTPLASVQAFMSNILAGIYGEVDDITQKELRAAEVEVKNTISMVNDLIDIERMKSGRFPLNLITINLPAIFNEIIASSLSTQEAENIQIDAKQVYIKGDAKLIERLLLGIMQISLGYSIGSAPIKVAIQELNTEALLTIDSICDEEIIASEKYITETRTSLALCKIIAEIHDGNLEAKSQGNGVHHISLKLPLQKSDPTPKS